MKPPDHGKTIELSNCIKDDVKMDDGISGKSADKRPAFRLMIATAKEDSHPFDSIFVWKYSRFARNQEEAIMYKNLLKKKGVDVKSISEPSSDSPFASLIERIIEWMDEYYLINLAGEVRRGMKEKATRGEAMSRAPFGYRIENKTFIPDENADIVRYIFQRYAAGAGYWKLVMELADMGAKSPKGNALCKESVDYILHNPVYIGKTRWSEDGRLNHFRPHTMEDMESIVYVDGKHEAIVDMGLWEQVQEKLMQRHSEANYIRKSGHMFMLKGILRCGTCGATLTLLSGGKSLQCCSYTRGVCRVSHGISIAKAEKLILNALHEIIMTDNYEFTPTEAIAPPVQRDWDKLISAESAKLERARGAYLAGVFGMEEYKAAKDSLEKSIRQLEAKRDQEFGKVETSVDISAYHKKALDVYQTLESPEVDEQTKNEAIRSIINKIVFNKPDGTFSFYFYPS